MNRLEKIAIFLVSVLLTVIGFDLMAAPVVEMLKIGRQAGYQIIANYLAKTGSGGSISPYSMYLKLPIGALLILAICAVVSFVVLKIISFSKKTRKRPKQKSEDRRSRFGQFQIPDSKTDF
jgi:hypothetical protein